MPASGTAAIAFPQVFPYATPHAAPGPSARANSAYICAVITVPLSHAPRRLATASGWRRTRVRSSAGVVLR